MIEITAKHPYRGHDPATGVELVLAPGQRARVSERKARQLRRDFPGWFDFAEPKASAPAPAKAEQPKAQPKRTQTRRSSSRRSTRKR